jgi:hypothetical protein
MRTTALILLLTVSGWADDAFGTWTMNPARSALAPDPRPKSIMIRIESHAKGEVLLWTASKRTAGLRRPAPSCTWTASPASFRSSDVREPNRRIAWTARPWRSCANVPAASGSGSFGDCPRRRMN